MGQVSVKLTAYVKTYTPVTPGTTSKANIIEWNATNLPATITYDNSTSTGYTWRCDFTLTNGSNTLVCGLVREYINNGNFYTLNAKLGTLEVKYFISNISFSEPSAPIEGLNNVKFSNSYLTTWLSITLNVQTRIGYFVDQLRSNDASGNINFRFYLETNGSRTLRSSETSNDLLYYYYVPSPGEPTSNGVKVFMNEAEFGSMVSKPIPPQFTSSGEMQFFIQKGTSIDAKIYNVTMIKWTTTEQCPAGVKPYSYSSCNSSISVVPPIVTDTYCNTTSDSICYIGTTGRAYVK